MNRFRAGIHNRLARDLEMNFERQVVSASTARPEILHDEEFVDVIHSPLAEVGDVAKWTIDHPSMEYTLWLEHIILGTESAEEREAIIRKRAQRRVAGAERAPLIFRLKMATLAIIGTSVGPLAGYGTVENLSEGRYGGAVIGALAMLGSGGVIKDAVKGWKSSTYGDLQEDSYRERMYFDRTMAHLDKDQPL